MNYNNPTPVVVLIIDVVDSVGVGLLGVVRSIEPGLGGIAFPGGYVDEMESGEMAAVRECNEEINFPTNEEDWVCLGTKVNHLNKLLLFYRYKNVVDFGSIINNFILNREVSDLVVIKESGNIIFPSHRDMFDVLVAMKLNGV